MFWFGVLTKLPIIQKSQVSCFLKCSCAQHPAFLTHTFLVPITFRAAGAVPQSLKQRLAHCSPSTHMADLTTKPRTQSQWSSAPLQPVCYVLGMERSAAWFKFSKDHPTLQAPFLKSLLNTGIP